MWYKWQRHTPHSHLFLVISRNSETLTISAFATHSIRKAHFILNLLLPSNSTRNQRNHRQDRHTGMCRVEISHYACGHKSTGVTRECKRFEKMSKKAGLVSRLCGMVPKDCGDLSRANLDIAQECRECRRKTEKSGKSRNSRTSTTSTVPGKTIRHLPETAVGTTGFTPSVNPRGPALQATLRPANSRGSGTVSPVLVSPWAQNPRPSATVMRAAANPTSNTTPLSRTGGQRLRREEEGTAIDPRERLARARAMMPRDEAVETRHAGPQREVRYVKSPVTTKSFYGEVSDTGQPPSSSAAASRVPPRTAAVSSSTSRRPVASTRSGTNTYTTPPPPPGRTLPRPPPTKTSLAQKPLPRPPVRLSISLPQTPLRHADSIDGVLSYEFSGAELHPGVRAHVTNQTEQAAPARSRALPPLNTRNVARSPSPVSPASTRRPVSPMSVRRPSGRSTSGRTSTSPPSSRLQRSNGMRVPPPRAASTRAPPSRPAPDSTLRNASPSLIPPPLRVRSNQPSQHLVSRMAAAEREAATERQSRLAAATTRSSSSRSAVSTPRQPPAATPRTPSSRLPPCTPVTPRSRHQPTITPTKPPITTRGRRRSDQHRRSLSLSSSSPGRLVEKSRGLLGKLRGTPENDDGELLWACETSREIERRGSGN